METTILDVAEDGFRPGFANPFLDSLTGLFTEDFFHAFLRIEIERGKRHGTSFTLSLMEIDDFSDFIQRHGPKSRDRLLMDLSEIFRKNGRTSDLTARLSDDRLAMLFTNTTPKFSMAAAKRILQSIRDLHGDRCTVSAGLASFPQDASSLEELFCKARESLGKAKSQPDKVSLEDERLRMQAGDRSKILVVDDEPRNAKLAEAFLTPQGYEVLKAYNGRDALSIVKSADVDLVILDIMMPIMDGYEVCRTLKGSEDTRMIPVIMVTALDSLDAKIKGIEAGADDFVTKPPNKLELIARAKSLIMCKHLNRSLMAMENILFSIANIVEAKDACTEGHIQRVANLSRDLGEALGLGGKDIEALKFGGILHDVGKIAVPSVILNKPGKLTEEEWIVMKKHPVVGYDICLPLKKGLGSALDIIRHHHEKLDGSGYPDCLKGAEIPLSARIMAVVDIYDALVSDRPYRKGMTREQALDILRQEVGMGRLDATVVSQLAEITKNTD